MISSPARVDLSPEANAPVVGKGAWVIGEIAAREDEHPAILAALKGSVATLFWWDEGYFLGPQWRGQCFRADRVTSSREVANASPRELRAAGWNI